MYVYKLLFYQMFRDLFSVAVYLCFPATNYEKVLCFCYTI